MSTNNKTKSSNFLQTKDYQINYSLHHHETPNHILMENCISNNIQSLLTKELKTM